MPPGIAVAVSDLYGALSHPADQRELLARQLWKRGNRPRLYGQARQISMTLADFRRLAWLHKLNPDTQWINGQEHYLEIDILSAGTWPG